MFWPSVCVCCSAVGEALCAQCMPLGRMWRPGQGNGVPDVLAWASYRSEVGVGVRRAKDDADGAALRVLARAMARAMPEMGGIDATLVPVPSTSWSIWTRGFAPASVVAHTLGRQWALPVADVLGRHRGSSQRGLGREARLGNLTDQLYVRGARPEGHLMLVDDVVTTGASAQAAATVLGRERVMGIVSLCLVRRKAEVGHSDGACTD